jgi:hypothetical protein
MARISTLSSNTAVDSRTSLLIFLLCILCDCFGFISDSLIYRYNENSTVKNPTTAKYIVAHTHCIAIYLS